MKIYTKTGDDGSTMLFGGGRVSKAAIRIEAYGTVDELNAVLGLLSDEEATKPYAEILQQIKFRLFTLGAILAANPDKKNVAPPDLLISDVEILETEMDSMTADLPPLKHFILPGGHKAVSMAHMARCVCRRAERRVVQLNDVSTDAVDSIVLLYLNRLSDYFFVLARHIAKAQNVEEIKWEPRTNK